MNEYQRTRQVTEALLNEGVFPTPKRVLERLGLKSTRDNTRRGGRGLNGVKSQARTEILQEAGYTKNILTGNWEWKWK